MIDRNPQRQRHIVPSNRLTRRRLVQLLTGSAVMIVGACRRGNAQGNIDPSATPEPMPTRETIVPPPNRTPVRSTATATPVPTPSTQPTASSVPDQQILYRGGFTSDPVSHDFNANLYCGGDPSLWSGLLTLNTDLTPMGDWAERWEPNGDSSAWTFHLRPENEGWSNGQPVTAHDFVWSWQRLVDPATKAPHAWLLYDVHNAVEIRDGKLKPSELGVQALDNWTLEVTLIGPRVYFPAIVATVGTSPAYRPAVQSYGEKWTEAAHCVSNGPFVLADWRHEDQWSTTVNSSHWNYNNVQLQKTVVPIFPAYKHQQPYFNQQVDFMPVSEDDVANVRSIADYSSQMISSTDPATWFLVVMPSQPPFGDIRVRQAIAHCIDRDRLEQVSQGRASSAQSLMPTTFPMRGEDNKVKALQQFDVDKALQLLSATSHANGTNWPPLTLLISEPAELPQLLAADCAQQLYENLGMRIQVKNVSDTEMTDALAKRSAALFWRRWDFTYADPNNGYADAFFPIGSSAPFLPLTPDGLGELIGRGKVEQNPDARALIYRECETSLQTQVSYIPIAYPITFYLIRPWVAGFPLVGDSSVLQPDRIFTRLTSFVSIKDRPVG